jgi:hypothetical protein
MSQGLHMVLLPHAQDPNLEDVFEESLKWTVDKLLIMLLLKQHYKKCFPRVSEINSWQICDHAIIQTALYRMKCVIDHAIMLTEKHIAIVLSAVQLTKEVMKVS